MLYKMCEIASPSMQSWLCRWSKDLTDCKVSNDEVVYSVVSSMETDQN